MKNINHFITVDLGASSGRVMLISIGNNIHQQEVYRFKNQPISEGDFLVWDFEFILNHIKAGIKQAFELEPNITSIGIDTWGCDYGYIDQSGKLIRNPICYRDTRTEGIDSFTKYYFSQSDLYKSTGIQHLRFNTIYQIACDLKYDKHLLE
ncbi:MAG: FGGY family carbohydrate kinase, partial [Acholeplasmataceae bacterium]|nr:FGGY family carbohydrate kinase [Acholeplasmataceae bacterium]